MMYKHLTDALYYAEHHQDLSLLKDHPAPAGHEWVINADKKIYLREKERRNSNDRTDQSNQR